MIRTCPLFLLAALAALPLAAAPGDSALTPFYTDSTFNGKLETTARRLPSPGTPRDSNNNDTAGYMDTQVQTQLRLDLGDKVDSVHFIRDNNDPLVVTKTYVLKHAEPYALRTYLREMVQTRRVSGSNTAVECLKFEDGVGLLFVSAEEYRFKDSENGMGIDAIVERLDRPGLLNSSGQPKYVYFPANVPAAVLENMVKKVGMNVSDDPAELIGGKDKVKLDPELNCLFFNTASYSRKNIEEMLRRYDVPIPEIRIRFSVYELYAENDEKLGFDFQAWKNNDGMDFFSTGGRYRDNWAAAYGGTMAEAQGSERTSFYNFNPKWNSRYLDFLASRGKAKIAHSGEVTVRQNTTSTLERLTQLFYMDTTVPAPETEKQSDDWYAKLFDSILAAFSKKEQKTEIATGRDNQESVTRDPNAFGFSLTVKALSIAPEAAMLKLTLKNSSLIGYQSTGAPRIQEGNTVTTDVMVSTARNRFVIGGLEKREIVRGSTGVPFLKDIPGIGYLFQVESESTRKSRMVLVAECEYTEPESVTPEETQQQLNDIRNDVAGAGGRNQYFYGQYGLDR